MEKEFGAELHARVGEIAEPSVLVLIPDLDDDEVKRVGGEDVSILVHKLFHDRLHLAEVGVGANNKRARLVFTVGGDNSDCPSLLAIGGNCIRQTLDAAHRRHRPPGHAGQRRNGRHDNQK